jgi:hypothetical protein
MATDRRAPAKARTLVDQEKEEEVERRETKCQAGWVEWRLSYQSRELAHDCV